MARRTFPGGLRAQLLIPVVILLVVTLALIGVATLQVTKRQLMQASQERALSIAHALSITLGDIPPDRHAEHLARHLEANRVDAIAWQTRPHAPIVATSRQVLDIPLREELTRPGNDTIVRRVGDRLYMFGTYAEGEHRTTVAIDMKELQDRVDLTRDIFLLFILVNAIFFMILGYAVFTFRVIRPLRAIGIATERAAQGDLASPIRYLPRNEFGLLGERFNIMLARLERQRETLQEQVKELEDANRAIQRAQHSLVRSEKLASVGQLAAGVAHEIGNPLAVVMGYAELLGDEDLEDDFRHEIGPKIVRQVQRIRVIIRELLDYSRDESGEEVTPVDLIECAREAIRLTSAIKRARGIQFEEDLPESAPRVMAIHSQIVQVLINLLLNASDAFGHDKPSDAAVMISLRLEGEQVIVSVCDNGPGIPEEIVNRLFEPFFTTKPPGEGTGLGLAICARIVENFHGSLQHVRSAQGACFELGLTRITRHTEDHLPEQAPREEE